MSSFWLSSESDQVWNSFQSNDNELEYDVIIIGGGVSGISTAYHLTQSGGYHCAVLEKNGISSGATGHNGGIIKTAVSSLQEYSKKHGLSTALDILNYSNLCIDEVKTVVETLDIDCELRFHGSLNVASSADELRELSERYNFLIDHGFSVEWWGEEICQFNTKCPSHLGGIYWPSGGNIWAAKLVFALTSQILRNGSSIHTGTTVSSVELDPSSDSSLPHYRVTTNRGTFHCSKVVYACNAWCRQLLPSMENILVPVRNQVIITTPLPRLWSFSIITNDGYEYMMQRPDGRIVLGMKYFYSSLMFTQTLSMLDIGGMRDVSETKEYNSDNTTDLNQAMSEKLHQYLPQNYDLNLSEKNQTIVEKEWIGIMCFTPDHQPLIGPLSHHQGQYILAGYSGHGMPVAFLAGKHIAQMICGRFDEENKNIPEVTRVLNQVYNPSRFGL
jgi:gamma-glutamylputrescine oxidase